MDHRYALERILALEDAIDTTALRAGDLLIWPLVRRLLWDRMLYPHRFPSEPPLDLRAWALRHRAAFIAPEAYALYGRHLEAHQRELEAIANHGRADTFFFSRREEHLETVEGHTYNTYLDPMIDLVRGRRSYVKVEMASTSALRTLPRFEPTFFVDSMAFLELDARRALIEAFTDEPPPVAGLEPLFETLRRLEPGFPLSPEYLRLSTERLRYCTRYFTTLLHAVRPQIVFLATPTTLLGMGLVGASFARGAVSVAIQQGTVAPFHAGYTHWRNPEPLVPDNFWCWGEAHADWINHSLSPAARTRHRALNGGNRRLAHWRQLAALRPTSNQSLLRPLQRGNGRRVLVTLLQATDRLPDAFLEAVRLAPPTWEWLVRLHPEDRDRVVAFEATLGPDRPRQLRVREATEEALYEVLREVDYHVTEGSAAAYEAIAMGVPTTVVGPRARVLFEAAIEAGLVQYTTHACGIVAQVGADLEARPAGDALEPFLTTSETTALDALYALLEPAMAETEA